MLLLARQSKMVVVSVPQPITSNITYAMFAFPYPSPFSSSDIKARAHADVALLSPFKLLARSNGSKHVRISPSSKGSNIANNRCRIVQT